MDPAELLRIGREQILAYPTVQFRPGLVTAIQPQDEGFMVTLETGETMSARKVLLRWAPTISCLTWPM
ncbi:MAG: hypothetical protein R3E79_15940 [Caldilineaceae bacterium]